MLEDVFQAVVPVFAVVAVGALARYLRWFSEKTDEGLMRLVVNLFYPALLLSFILGNPLLKSASFVFLPMLCGFVSMLVSFGVAILLIRFFRRLPPVDRRTFVFSTGIYNFGYVPIPLVLALFGTEATGVLLVFNAGVDMAIWSVGIILLSGSLGREWKRKLLNAPFVTMVVALIFNGAGLDAKVPGPALATLDYIAACAIPLALLLIGGVVFDLVRQSSLLRDLSVSALACFHRLLLVPAIFVAAALLLPLPSPLPEIIVIQAAMPCGLFSMVLAQYYGGNTRIAFLVIVWTSLVGIVTLPTWIVLGLSWVGG
jgi:predicted permease